MGTAGTASTTRAKTIHNAFIRDASNYDSLVEIISENKYNAIPDKTTRGTPYWLFYDPKYPLGYIYLYPTPDAADTAYIESLQLLQSITNVTTTISLPGEYEEAIIYNLAIRLAPEHEVPIPGEVLGIAISSLDAISVLNAANQIETVPLDPGIAGGGRPYNINTDC